MKKIILASEFSGARRYFWLTTRNIAGYWAVHYDGKDGKAAFSLFISFTGQQFC